LWRKYSIPPSQCKTVKTRGVLKDCRNLAEKRTEARRWSEGSPRNHCQGCLIPNPHSREKKARGRREKEASNLISLGPGYRGKGGGERKEGGGGKGRHTDFDLSRAFGKRQPRRTSSGGRKG